MLKTKWTHLHQPDDVSMRKRKSVAPVRGIGNCLEFLGLVYSYTRISAFQSGRSDIAIEPSITKSLETYNDKS